MLCRNVLSQLSGQVLHLHQGTWDSYVAAVVAVFGTLLGRQLAGGKVSDTLPIRFMFHHLTYVSKLGLRVFTNLVGCAPMCQNDTCLSQIDTKYRIICLLLNRFLGLTTRGATLLRFWRREEENTSWQLTQWGGNVL